MALNKRQQEFIKYYISGIGGKESVIKAGYTCKHPDKYANYLINKKNIKEELESLQETLKKELGVTVEWIAENIKNIATNGKNDSDKLRALELLGKWKSMFTENTTNVAIFAGEEVNKMLGNVLDSRSKLPMTTIDVEKC